jgi:hypothetical protein
MRCPICENKMEPGFSLRSSPQLFVTKERVRKPVHKVEDLNRPGWKSILSPIASYIAANHCSICKIRVVDYGEPISSKVAKGDATSVS